MTAETSSSPNSASRLLPALGDAVRAQERGADISDHGARADCSPASVAATFYQRGKVVGREGSRQGCGNIGAGPSLLTHDERET
jgi:hypothetical protein